MARPLILAVLLAGLPAQERVDFEPVRLPVLGQAPAGAAVARLARDGAVSGLETALEGEPASIVLEVDRRTPAAAVGAVVERCRAAGVERVLFSAVLSGRGEPGVFTMALPDAGEHVTDLELRLHRDSPGVPPDSLRHHLRRIASGFEQARKEPLQLGVRVPGDSEIEPVLQVLSAVARGGVGRAVVHWERTAAQQRVADASPGDSKALAGAQAARERALALTLGPVPLLDVPAAAVPLPRPEVREQPVGLLERARTDRGAEPPRGGAGGRYGGRRGLVGRRVPAALAEMQEAIGAGLVWLERQQLSTGAWPGEDREDLESTAWALLAFLGEGRTLVAGASTGILRRGIGWVMAQQAPDGRIGPPGTGSVRRHALATYALAEASGLSGSPHLRGHLQAAIGWLEDQRLTDGGWNDGTSGAPSDTLSTAYVHIALLSSAFFEIDVSAKAAGLADWFDEVVDPATGAHRMHAGEATDGEPETAFTSTAAALFCRFFDGQDPRTNPIMEKSADLILSVGLGKEAVSDPLRCYFTTYAFYQAGSRHWAGWSKVLTAELLAAREVEGEHAGSWPPAEGHSPVTSTTLRILTLQAFYRYTRLVR